MLVQQILKSKPDGAVVTVKPGTPVSGAIKVLAENRIGSVVVSPDGKTAIGILSERDIVRELANGPDVLDGKVDDYMTTKLVTCGAGDESADIAAQMTEGRFRHMPVLRDGEMIGLITLGDVVKVRLTELAMEKTALEGMIMGH